MTPLSRRAFLAASAAATAATAAPALSQTAPFLRSDIGALKTVLVHSITATDSPIDALGDDLLPYAETDMAAAVSQQQGLMRLLQAQGVRTIELREALATAIDATKSSGVFGGWLDAAVPRLGADPSKVTADTLLGRDPAMRYRLGADGSYRHIVDDSTSTMWTRDSAFMTPQGLVICNAASRRRARENMLLRFAYAYSPLLKPFPIAFDAVEEGINIEGGDATVVDERTLMLGVGNRTDPRAAPLLAQRLNMDVVAVSTRKVDFLRQRVPGEAPKAMALRTLFLHLDTYFTHVAPKHALTLPFVFEHERSEDNPLARYIKGARAETLMEEDEAEEALKMLKDLGKVTVYARGTGKKEELKDTKLVDYLKKERYRLTYTGGEPPKDDAGAFRHFMDVVYPEHRRQATNIVQVRPGRVIAYEGNPATRAALEKDGLGVDLFPARELWAWHGGPHCLTQPLERA